VRRDLRLLLDLITDMEFARALETSRGLCLPHLDLVRRLAPVHPNLLRLLEVHIPTVKHLQADFQDFLRRAKAPVPTLAPGEAAAVWARMLEWTEGKAAVFGPKRDLARQGMGWRRLVALARRAGTARSGSVSNDGEQGRMSELHRLALENEKLQRRLVEVSREWAEASARRAALQYRVHKLSEDVKVLELNVAGARGEAQSGEIQAARLRLRRRRVRPGEVGAQKEVQRRNDGALQVLGREALHRVPRGRVSRERPGGVPRAHGRLGREDPDCR
jgi:hypothetical protein